jgi:erythronate-4-phosphate dehydrogenase
MKLRCCIDPTIPLLEQALQPFARLYPVAESELSTELLRRLRCQVLIVRTHVRVDAQLLERTPVRFVASPSAGLDHIAVEELRARGITVAHAPGCNANAVAEYTIFAVLRWALILGRPLSKERIGIVGFGHIGRRVALYARRLGMEVWVNDPPLERQGFAFPEWVHPVPLAELLRGCQVVTVHVPLTRTGEFPTYHLLGEQELGYLQRVTLLVNSARGGVVDELALLRELERRELFLAFDVWETEPRPRWELAVRAMLATPHIAGHTWQGRVRCTWAIVQALAQWAGFTCPDELFHEALSQAPRTPPVPWDDPQELHQLLCERRRLPQDTQQLQLWRLLPESLQAETFQRFRQSYPRRYELLRIDPTWEWYRADLLPSPVPGEEAL